MFSLKKTVRYNHKVRCMSCSKNYMKYFNKYLHGDLPENEKKELEKILDNCSDNIATHILYIHHNCEYNACECDYRSECDCNKDVLHKRREFYNEQYNKIIGTKLENFLDKRQKKYDDTYRFYACEKCLKDHDVNAEIFTYKPDGEKSIYK